MTKIIRAVGASTSVVAVMCAAAALLGAGACSESGWYGSRPAQPPPAGGAAALNSTPTASGNDRISYDRVAARTAPRAGTSSAARGGGGGATAAEAPMMRVQERPAGRTAPPSPAAAGRADGDTVRQVLAFPTGLRDTSVLLLEKTGPRQVLLDRPFTYELRVTNLTDYTLADVVVVEEYLSDMLDLRHAGDAAARGPTTAPSPDADAALAATLDEAERAVRAAEQLVTTEPSTGPATRPSAVAPTQPTTRPAEGGGRRASDSNAIAAPRAASSERFMIGELGPRQSRTITVHGVASRVGSAVTCTSVSYRPTLCAVTQVINPILKLTRAGPQQSHICDEITYRYTVANTGTGTARNVTIRETLPDGLTSDGGSRGIALEVGDLPEGTSRDFSVPVRAARPGEYASRATATMAGSDEPVRSDELTTSVKAGRLTVEVSAPEMEYVNKVVNFPVFVKNDGDAEAREVTLDVRADGGGDLIGFAATAGGVRTGTPAANPTARAASAAGVIRQSLGTIRPGETARADVSVRAKAGGDLKLTATARSGCIQPATGVASTTVKTLPALLLEVVDREDPVRVGENTVYRVTVKNQGTGPDEDVKVTATLPDSETFVRAAGATAGQADGRTVTFTPVPSLAPGQMATWEVEVKADRADDARFQIDLTSKSLTKPVTENESTRIY